MNDPRALLAKEWTTIERITAFIGRRYRLRPEEVEDLTSLVALKLYENDCAVIREFRGASSLITYLRVVVRRIFLDDYIHEKGKWHSSAEAKRLGPIAIELERLIHRDGLPRELAIAQVRPVHPEIGDEELELLLARLPQRTRWSRVPLDESVAESTPNCDEADLLTIDRERQEISARAAAIIRQYLTTVPPHDRLMLQFQFDSNMQISQIARMLQIDQAVLYRRRQKLFRELAAALQSEGIRSKEIYDLIGHMDNEVDFGLKSKPYSPSLDEGNRAAAEGDRGK